MDKTAFDLRLPDAAHELDQHEEFVYFIQNGEERRIRLQDYGTIYRTPGLYERLLSDLLDCHSPEVMVTLLGEQLAEAGTSFADLRILEIGAGTGMVGELLRQQGVQTLVGIDIEPAAEEAARRDRPGVYDEYYTADLTQLPDEIAQAIRASNCNALACVSASGYHHIPKAAFQVGFNLIQPTGWVALNIRAEYLQNPEWVAQDDLPRLLLQIGETGVLAVRTSHTYRHRLTVAGRPLYYTGIVGKKLKDIA